MLPWLLLICNKSLALIHFAAFAYVFKASQRSGLGTRKNLICNTDFCNEYDIFAKNNKNVACVCLCDLGLHYGLICLYKAQQLNSYLVDLQLQSGILCFSQWECESMNYSIFFLFVFFFFWGGEGGRAGGWVMVNSSPDTLYMTHSDLADFKCTLSCYWRV